MPTGDAKPIFHRGYQLNGIRQTQIRSALDKLEKEKVLERGSSPWSNPVFLVSKGDGRIRLTTDYRQLNKLVELERFPLRNIPNLLQELAGFNRYSLLDLTQGYHAVQTTPEAKMKTSLISGDRQYLVNRMLFGCANAPAIFSQVMDLILKDIPVKDGLPIAIFYMDDIIVRSRGSPRDHFEDIKATIKVIANAGLKLNLLKLDTFRTSIKLLGRQIDALGVSPQEKHVQTIQSFPKPEDRPSLQRFIGLCAYHSNLIPCYAKQIAPLSALNREVPFQWGPTQQEAFDNLKRIITLRTKTYFVDFDEPIYLSTDASDTHYGGYLFQIKSYLPEEWQIIKDQLENMDTDLQLLPKPRNPTYHPTPMVAGKNCPKQVQISGTKMKVVTLTTEEEQALIKKEEEKIHLILPIGFHSRAFQSSQKNWIILEKEAFAISQCLQHFKETLLSSKVTYLMTDSAVYLWTLKAAKLGSTKIQRWIVAMSAIPHTVVASHVKNRGNAMTVSDAISRPYFTKVISDKRFTNKIAFKITSPFPIGSVLTVEDIEQALNSYPNLVDYIPIKHVNLIHSKLVAELEPLVTMAKFAEHQ